MRKFEDHTTQRIKYFSGKVQNIKNNGGKCLDVHGASNTNNRHVIYYNCHNGANQGWDIDQRGEITSQPVHADEVKFQIRTKMALGRAITVTEHIGGH